MPTKISKMARLSNKIFYASLKKESYGCANKALNTNLKLIQQEVFDTPLDQLLNLNITNIPINILIDWSEQLENLLSDENKEIETINQDPMPLLDVKLKLLKNNDILHE